MRAKLLISALLVLLPSSAWAEWQVKPFLGVTFGGTTTLIDLEETAGNPNVAIGASALLVGEVFGIEGDVGFSPGFFGREEFLVRDSSVTTMTANLYVGLPRRWFLYTLRPYVVAGGGVMRVRGEDRGQFFRLDQTLPTWDVGGGATGFVTDRMGVSWELRYFRGFSGDDPTGVSFGSETLSFFRAMMALTIRLDRNVP
jgi:opacity protein-like surface antigen